MLAGAGLRSRSRSRSKSRRKSRNRSRSKSRVNRNRMHWQNRSNGLIVQIDQKLAIYSKGGIKLELVSLLQGKFVKTAFVINVGTDLIQKQGAMPKTGQPSKGLVIKAFTLLCAFSDRLLFRVHSVEIGLYLVDEHLGG